LLYSPWTRNLEAEVVTDRTSGLHQVHIRRESRGQCVYQGLDGHGRPQQLRFKKDSRIECGGGKGFEGRARTKKERKPKSAARRGQTRRPANFAFFNYEIKGTCYVWGGGGERKGPGCRSSAGDNSVLAGTFYIRQTQAVKNKVHQIWGTKGTWASMGRVPRRGK